MKRVCKQCGREFIIAQSEVIFYKGKNLQLPRRCKECREANKQQKTGMGERYGPQKDLTEAELPVSAQRPGKMAAEKNVPSQKQEKRSAKADVSVQRAEKRGAKADASSQRAEKGSTKPDVSVQNFPKRSAEPDMEGQKPQRESIGLDMQAQNPGRGTAASGTAVQKQEPAGKKFGLKAKLLSVAAVLAVIITGRMVPGLVDDSVPAEMAVVSQDVSELTFRNSKNLEEHYQKHGIEMGFASAEEYQAAAAAVVGNPEALHKIEAEDGDDVYYIEDTNEFVIVSTDGYIRTYFYPDAGIEYFNRQ